MGITTITGTATTTHPITSTDHPWRGRVDGLKGRRGGVTPLPFYSEPVSPPPVRRAADPQVKPEGRLSPLQSE
jgi:hypothetical protein